MATWTTGNAVQDSQDTRGWLVGHFIDQAEGVRRSSDVEIKWGVHPAGDKREQWADADHRTTLVILVSGHFVVHLEDGRADFTEPGDYVMWGPGTDHSWEALTDSVVMTVRWPSAISIAEPVSG